jgi:ABC-type transport system involved in multi-copper enzyme maturation permease subunit
MINPFGPIVRFDLVRIARRQRITLSRSLYILALAAIAAATYWMATRNWTIRTRPQDLARITLGLFCGLLAVQFLLAGAMPNLTADAIAGEKERRTLPFLLATPLGDWQIILGKLTARLAQVGMFVLAGLPVLCALQFFGGVEPLLLLIGYAVLAVSALSLGSLAVLASVYARTARQAAQLAARNVGAYLFAMYALNLFFLRWPPPAYIRTGADWLNAGNPLHLATTIVDAVRGGSRLDDVVLPAVGEYAIFHCIAAGLFVTWAARRLRPVAAEHAEGPPPPKVGMRRPPPRPPVGNRPVLWKARYFDFRQIRSVIGGRIARLLFVVSFMPLVATIVFHAIERSWHKVPENINMAFVRVIGSIVLSALLVMIAANASSSFAVERRKRTLDDLLLSDLSAQEILGQKWWASILVIRWALVWVGIHWLVATIVGGLHPLAAVLMAAEWAVYAAFAASLGVYAAARWPSARKAGVVTGLTGFAAVSIPLVISMLILLAVDARMVREAWMILPASTSPPVLLGVSGFTGPELAVMRGQHPSELAMLLVGGTLSIGAAAISTICLWRGACHRFLRAVG